MVSATRETPTVTKRQFSSVFTPPAGYRGSISKAEVTVEEILAGGVNEDDWSFPFVATTPSEDRVGDVVIPEGCIYKNFSASPIFFFDHQNIRFPIGTLRSPHDGRLYFAVEPGRGIIGRVWINKRADSDHGRVCKDLFYLVVDGLLNGISVGFEPRGQVKALHTGGSLYSQWELLEISLVAIPANADCTIIRRRLDEFNRAGKEFHPLVLKSLTAMSNAAIADVIVTNNIRYEEGKWVLYDQTVSKVLGSYETHEEAIKAHEKSAGAANVKKAMTESSGTGGGVTIPEQDHPDNSAIHKAIKDRMEDHKHGEHGGTHEAHFNAESGAVHHVHGAEASPEHLKSVHEDLAAIDGVRDVHQSPERPGSESGYSSVYPAPGEDGNVKKDDMGDATEEMSAKVAVEKAARKAEQRTKRIAVLVKSGENVQQMLKSGVFNWMVRKSIEDCVSQKIKYLHDSGEAEKHGWKTDQIAAVAYHYCGEKHLPASITKAMPQPEKKEGDAAAAREEEEHELPMDEAAQSKAPGVAAFQTIIENIEAMAASNEPEVTEHLEKIVQLARDLAEERYPEEDFGGEQSPDPSEDSANDAKEEEQTREDLERYRRHSHKPRRTKRYVAAVRLKALRHPDHASAIHKAATHCHAVGDMPAAEIEHKGHKGMFIKGYEAKHHSAHRIMGRALDRVHGAIAKSEDEIGEDHKLDAQQQRQGGKPDEPLADSLDLDRVLPALKSFGEHRDKVDSKMESLMERAGTGKRA